MKSRKLFEIVETLKDVSTKIPVDQLIPYKRSLMTIYGKDAILLVTDFFNAGCIARVVRISDLPTELDSYIESLNLDEDEAFAERETIVYNSIPLKNI